MVQLVKLIIYNDLVNKINNSKEIAKANKYVKLRKNYKSNIIRMRKERKRLRDNI